MSTPLTNIPREGMLATVRNRFGLVSSVEPFDSPTDGRLHMVSVEYTDPDGVPDDTVLWEREVQATVVEPNALPVVASDLPMAPAEFDALVRATRWSALTPFLGIDDPTKRAELPIAAPFHGAVQVDDFQLVPLLKALQMPRVSILLADDVGLGKTIEAGLILSELLLRRRIRRVLILSPAALRLQWQQEMKDKFSLTFDQVDRAESHELRKRLGMDANPWRSFPRIVASYYYLRQPDILEEFLSTCRPRHAEDDSRAQLPWDLLIVDEAHNLMPAPFGDDSDLTAMLRAISPYFEHKLFLTATPHNGYTRSFSGLLELLDPVRFTRTNEFSEAAKKRVEEVVVRRLKREVNEVDTAAGRQPRFAERFLKPEPLFFGVEEKALTDAFWAFRDAVHRQIQSSKRGEQLAGSFAIEVLNKRLLSCPYAFAESWLRFKDGIASPEAAESSEVVAAKRAVLEETDDDQERQGRERHAAITVGAWIKPFLDRLQTQVAGIDAALEKLRLRMDGETVTDPIQDARFDRLAALIRERIRAGSAWGTDERLIIFTEYKTTLDYLVRRLRREFKDDGSAIQELYGGLPWGDREAIKGAFNDPASPVRVLVATDAASEGLNLQETARLLMHYDIPWNPSRLEQRNGRLDRHGQARDVYVHHFTSDGDADVQFLAKVIAKVHEIREDLGTMGEVFDKAFERRFRDQVEAQTITESLDREIRSERGRAAVESSTVKLPTATDMGRMTKLTEAIDLNESTLRDTLAVAMGIGTPGDRLQGPDAAGRMRLTTPVPSRWEAIVDDELRMPSKTGLGALPALVFDPRHFIDTSRGRPVFRPSKDTVLLHLGHPVFRHALSAFARARFPGGSSELGATRWLVRRGPVPAGADALILLTVEELGLNALRETFHQWVRTIRLPVVRGELGTPLPYEPPAGSPTMVAPAEADIDTARDIWDAVELELKRFIGRHVEYLTGLAAGLLEGAKLEATTREQIRYTEQIAEVSAALRKQSIARLEKEIEELRLNRAQGSLFADVARDQEERLRSKEEELERRRKHAEEHLRQLREDQRRILDDVLPRRYSLRGKVSAFPVAVEIRLPG